MAYTNTQSLQLQAKLPGALGRLFPMDEHGKVRHEYFDVTQGAAAGDIGSDLELVKIPIGRVRILPYATRIWGTALGAGRLLSLGHRAYRANGGVDEPENAAAFGSGLDVSAATVGVSPGAAIPKYDIFSRKGVVCFARITGGTIPAGANLKGWISYLYE